MYKIVTLATGKEANVAFRHPWIFSGALASIADDLEHGDFVSVLDKNGKVLGTGTYSANTSIAVRVWAFHDVKLDEAFLKERLQMAQERRSFLGYGPGTHTTGYRLVFGEVDGLPGLVVDRYDDVLVMQIATMGMDRQRDMIVKALVDVFQPRIVIERSDMPVRREEKLEPVVAVRHGDATMEGPLFVDFLENGVKLRADVVGGQKTGFYFDQKELRRFFVGRSGQAAREQHMAKDRRVLNLFSYSGGTGLAVALSGAKSVQNLDGSEAALALAAENAKLNGLDEKVFSTEKADVFQWLGEHTEPEWDMVIMDPPALIKNSRETEEGKKAYHFLNRAAIRLVKDGGIFITSSCSHFLPEEDLAFILRRASVQIGVRLDIISVIRQAPDHPLSVYFPEAAYLKTFVCRVVR